MNTTTLIRSAAIGVGAFALLGGAWTAFASPVFTPTDATVSAAVAADLSHMRDEERLARDLYAAIAKQYDNAAPFATITISEQRHYDSMGVLLTRYGVADPSAGKAAGVYSDPELQKLYDTLWAKAKTSINDAYAVGVAVEKADIADLKKAMEGDSADKLKAAIATFEQAMQAMSAGMAGAGGGGPADAGAAAGATTGKGGDEDIKDADFEVK